MAVQEVIDDVELKGGSGTVFDPANDKPGNDECLTADVDEESAYSSIDDGSASVDHGAKGFDDDAFDDGLVMLLNGKIFVDGDDKGNLVGEQLRVGPSLLSGFKVTRTDRALATSPNLRSLITLKNTKNRAKSARIVIESDYGADTTEVVRGSAVAPKLFYTKNDNWLVVADDATSPDDAIVTHAFFGKGANERVEKVKNGIPNGDSCLSVQYGLKVPGKSTRHLMLFTQLSESDDADDAKLRAQAFGKAKLARKFLVGLNGKTKKKIVNWDLG